MKRAHALFAVMLLLSAMTAVNGCWPFDGNDKLCCEEYQPEDNQATYCNNHRDAVMKFVLEDPEVIGQQQRLQSFEAFYETVKDCPTVDCIETAVAGNLTLPGFADRYRTEHEYAERDAVVPADTKAGLVLCGFRHAIEALKKTVGGQ